MLTTDVFIFNLTYLVIKMKRVLAEGHQYWMWSQSRLLVDECLQRPGASHRRDLSNVSGAEAVVYHSLSLDSEAPALAIGSIWSHNCWDHQCYAPLSVRLKRLRPLTCFEVEAAKRLIRRSRPPIVAFPSRSWPKATDRLHTASTKVLQQIKELKLVSTQQISENV